MLMWLGMHNEFTAKNILFASARNGPVTRSMLFRTSSDKGIAETSTLQFNNCFNASVYFFFILAALQKSLGTGKYRN